MQFDIESKYPLVLLDRTKNIYPTFGLKLVAELNLQQLGNPIVQYDNARSYVAAATTRFLSEF